MSMIPTTTLSVMKVGGGWAPVMEFRGRDAAVQIERAAGHAATLAGISGIPTRITTDWPEEED